MSAVGRGRIVFDAVRNNHKFEFPFREFRKCYRGLVARGGMGVTHAPEPMSSLVEKAMKRHRRRRKRWGAAFGAMCATAASAIMRFLSA